jgi:hypothetical protein
MARQMKTVAPARPRGDALVIVVDPLEVARGHRALPRGGRHGSGKHPSRAKAKRQWRRAEDGRRWAG